MKFFFQYLFWFTIILFVFSCGKVKTDSLTNLNNNKISVLGHRGSGMSGIENTYPDNTLESMEVGVDELGSDGIEMDIQLSKDNQLMLYHNNELMSTTSCSGTINSYTKDELSHCLIDASFYNAPMKEYHLASLEEVFERFKNYSPPPICFLDTKHYYEADNYPDITDFNLDFAQAIYTLIAKYSGQENTLVSSSNKEMLQILKLNYPSLKLVLHSDNFETALSDASALGLFGITIHYKYITRQQIETAHSTNLRVTLWGARTKEDCKAVARLFPDYVKTDNVSYMLSLAK